MTQACEIETLRGSTITALESTMSSPDKKRLARYLSTLSFAFSDIMAVITRSAMMFPFPKLAVLARATDQAKARELWQQDQLLVRSALETMKEKLRTLNSHLQLANDKALNPYGFATIDRMEKFAEVEKVATKAELEAFKTALVAQDKANAGKKKRSRPAKNKNGNNKRRGNANNNPDFPRCKACNKLGHLEGDARCKAAPKTNA